MIGIIILGLLIVLIVGMITIPFPALSAYDCSDDRITMKKFNSDKIHCVWTESAAILEKRGWGYTGSFYEFTLDVGSKYSGPSRLLHVGTWDITKNLFVQSLIHDCATGVEGPNVYAYVSSCELAYYNGTVFDILHTTEPERWIAGN